LKIRADEHVSFRIVQAVQLLCLRPGWELSHVRDEHAARTADETWLPKFAADGGRAILTADANILKRPHQLVALEKTGLISIVLSKHWQHAKRHEQAAHIIYWWPRIQHAIEGAAAGDCFPIPFVFNKLDLKKKSIAFDKAAEAISRQSR
jgi:hypothetical protein